MLLELMGLFAMDPLRALMVGDTSHDLQMAANAGVAAVGVSYGAHEAEALAGFGPLELVHSTAELNRWLAANA